VPLHLTSSDACEIFFSKIGGMQGLECAYDFHELVGCTNILNHLFAIEYGDNGLQFGRVHNKLKIGHLQELLKEEIQIKKWWISIF
jgi:hypothetical protein